MIHSHIMYCLSIYSCANTTSLSKLRIKQKAAVRTPNYIYVMQALKTILYRPLFAQLKILPLDQLESISILKFTHSFTHNLLPFSFHATWITNTVRFPERELRNADQLFIPGSKFLKALISEHGRFFIMF
jgi:hypothetical protein